MPISFHCQSCKKKIKAPDNAGGKWGNCPFCKHRCYIPSARSADEPELKLAPLDPSEETQINSLIKETKTLTQSLLAMEMPVEDDADSHGDDRTAEEKEIIKKCIIYLRQMADGQLGPAESTIAKLKKHHKKPALRILASMARAEKPEPELADLPGGILQGLIRDASTKLS